MLKKLLFMPPYGTSKTVRAREYGMSGAHSFFIFTRKAFSFAVEVIKILEVSEVKGADLYRRDGLSGLWHDFRGQPSPVIDLTALGHEVVMGQELSQALVIETAQIPVTLLIDSVREFVRERGVSYRFPGLFRTEKNKYINSMYVYDNRISYILEPEALIVAAQLSM